MSKRFLKMFKKREVDYFTYSRRLIKPHYLKKSNVVLYSIDK